MRTAFAAAAATAACLLPLASSDATSFCDPSDGWSIVFRDEFDGDSLDNTSWTVDLGADDSRTRHAQGTADNVYVTNGTLVLRSRVQPTSRRHLAHGHGHGHAQAHDGETYKYSTGAVQTQDKRFWSGLTRVCVSAKLPGADPDGSTDKGQGDGVWPAHWLMPNTKTCWPMNGEIDIMEMINGDGVLHGTYHYSNTTCGQDSSKGSQTTMPKDWPTAFHEYAVEYSPDHVTFVVDGKPYYTVTSEMAQLYDVPWYLILNTALGGPWPEPVDNHTTMPTYHVIDYVRVAQPTNATLP